MPASAQEPASSKLSAAAADIGACSTENAVPSFAGTAGQLGRPPGEPLRQQHHQEHRHMRHPLLSRRTGNHHPSHMPLARPPVGGVASRLPAKTGAWGVLPPLHCVPSSLLAKSGAGGVLPPSGGVASFLLRDLIGEYPQQPWTSLAVQVDVFIVNTCMRSALLHRYLGILRS